MIGEHLIELEKLLGICQNLKVLLLKILYDEVEIPHEEKLKDGEIILNILINSSPNNLRELRFFDEFEFSLENLEEFFENWSGQQLSIITRNSVYIESD